MAFLPGQPDINDLRPSVELAEGEKPGSDTQLGLRRGYKGKPGPYWEEARPVFDTHWRELERQMKRYVLHKLAPMYPPPLTPEQAALKKRPPRIEQTPFGPVTASPAGRTNDPNYINTGNVSYIQTRNAHYKNPDPEAPEPEGSLSYGDLAGRLASNGGPEMAHEILRQVYTTLAQRFRLESDGDRQLRCQALQAESAKNWTPDQRRTMAVLYALTILSEEQRSGAGKTMRSALRLIADGRMSPGDAFVAKGKEGPAVIQTEPEGMEHFRFAGKGGQKPSKPQALVYGDESSSSDADDDFEDIATHFDMKAKQAQNDAKEIKLSKLRAQKRFAGESTRDVEGTQYHEEAARIRGQAEETEQKRGTKRKLAAPPAEESSRAAKGRRVDDGQQTDAPRRKVVSVGEVRRSARLAKARALGQRGEKRDAVAAEMSTFKTKRAAKKQALIEE